MCGFVGGGVKGNCGSVIRSVVDLLLGNIWGKVYVVIDVPRAKQSVCIILFAAREI